MALGLWQIPSKHLVGLEKTSYTEGNLQRARLSIGGIMVQHPQQRRFSRIPFDAQVELSQDGLKLEGPLVDISLKGLLTVQPDADLLVPERPIQARISLDNRAQIIMHCRLAHREAQHLGLACESIDLNSIAHLRRLMELNLGNAAALDRELSELIAS